MTRADAQALLRLGATLERHFGLLSRGAEDRAVATALETVAARHGLPADVAVEKATQSLPLLREVAGQLGVGEAFFFRHAEVLDVATQFIVRRAEQQAAVRVWSAGCCRGEEPYSLAIALSERLGPAWASRVALAACDVSDESLEAARRAEYTEWSFRGAVSAARRAAAFEPASRGRWRLKAELRAVRFEHLAVQELVARLAPGEVDAFLFRNVAVYFAPAAVQPLFEAMAVALAPGGMLCLAPTDPQPETRLLSRDPVHPSIYWKGAAPGQQPRGGLAFTDAGRGAPPRVSFAFDGGRREPQGEAFSGGARVDPRTTLHSDGGRVDLRAKLHLDGGRPEARRAVSDDGGSVGPADDGRGEPQRAALDGDRVEPRTSLRLDGDRIDLRASLRLDGDRVEPRASLRSDGDRVAPPARLADAREREAPLLSDARRLADAGRLDEALALLARPGADARAVPQLVLRGQLGLSGGRLKDARHDFRRALYLAPEHLWARYWLTLTQLREGHADAARVQLRELERQLADRPGDERLADGPGTVDELRGAVAELKGRLQ